MAKSLKQLSDKIDARAQQSALQNPPAPNKPSAPRDSLKKLRTHVDAIEQRLKAAQTLSQSSVTALSTSFEKLQHAGFANNDTAQLAIHIDKLSSYLTDLIAQTRSDVAHDLQEVIADPRLEILSAALTKANQRLSKSESQQRGAIDGINAQIGKLAANLEATLEIRLQEEARERTVLKDKMGEEFSTRINTLETQSADAIKTIGDKIVDVGENLQSKAETLRHEMGEKALHLVESHEEHKADMAMRIEALEDDQRNTIPSLERRIVTMTTRLEVLENREPPAHIDERPTALAPPPHVETPLASDPKPIETPSEIYPAQTDAFSPVEPVISSRVSPPQHVQDLSCGIGEVSPNAVVETFTPTEFIPEEYTPAHSQADLSCNISPQNTTAHAPFNMQTGAFEQVGMPDVEANIVQDIAPLDLLVTAETQTIAPPPFAQGVAPPPMQNIELQAESMLEARPGAGPEHSIKSSLKDKFFKNKPKAEKISRGGGGPSMPVKTTMLMVGVAVVGLLAAKTVLPKFIGGETPTAMTSSQTRADVLGSNAQSAPQEQSRSVETIPAVGDYSGTMQAPNLGEDRNGRPSRQKLTLEAAATKGEPIAQFQLGLSHLKAGRDAQAVRLIQLAANQNQPAAQYRLGKLYEVGAGVKSDPKIAMQWLERAANGGNRIAMHDLGHYYATGIVQPADMPKAVNWFIKAAERGVLDSQFNLGVLYQGGAGIGKNLENAYVWYAIAGAQGDKVASQRSQLVAKDLKEEQLAGVIARVKNFTPTRINDAANGVFKDLPWTLSAPKISANNKAGGVKSAQSLLLSLGYDVGTPDGAMGPRTRNAVISFERANALPETGRVNAELLEKLTLAAGV